MASSDATAIPIKNQAYRVTFPIFDADGDLVTGATGLDSEVSKDGGTFADCTNEATEIATSSGMYYLDLTSTEMNADTVAVIVKSSGKTTPIVLYPAEAADIIVNVKKVNGTDQTAGDLAALIPSVAAIADGVWDEDATAHQTQGTFGQAIGDPGSDADTIWALANTNLNATVGSRSSHSAADVWAVGTRTLTSFGTLIADIWAAVVDSAGITTLLARLTATRAGYLDNLSAGAVALQSSVDDLEARVTEARMSELDAGTAGKMAAEVDIIKTTTAAIDAKTTNLPSDPADQSLIIAATDLIRTDIAGVQSDTDNIQTRLPAALVSGRMDASVGAMAANTLTASALASDAVTEIQSGLALSTQVDGVEAVTDKLNSAMELDGSVYRFTTNALEQAPAGGGGSTDWSADERTQIRKALGITGSSAATTGTGLLDLVKAKTDTIGNGTVTVVNPVSATGDITIVRGDDYFNADGRALSFTFSGMPSITGATVKMYLWYRAGERHPVTGTVTSSTAAYFEPATALTSLLVVPPTAAYYHFVIEAVLPSSSRIVTLHKGKCYVTEDEPTVS